MYIQLKHLVSNGLFKSLQFSRRVGFVRCVMDRVVDSATDRKQADSFRLLQKLDETTENQLHAIPSQTTVGERRLLYQFFRELWTGQGDVVEIGPFLGGTSRAIALGMLHNPRRQNGKLFTYDRFQDYFEVSRLTEYLQPLVDTGELDESTIRELGKEAPFIEIFKKIHGKKDYYACLEPSNHGVPDLVEQVNEGPWMSLPDGFQTDAVFIDGCKSWYGTKYFMKLMAPVARPGATFLFQDYGWFTCFWLAALIETFADEFSLIGNVDNTYAFSLSRALTADEIEKRFADSPALAGRETLTRLLDKQISRAVQRSDLRAVVRHTIHKAGALTYIGELEEARAVLKQAEKLPEISKHRTVLNKAWDSPTYSPDAPIPLGKN